MRIAISGTANVGKTSLIKDFLKEWDNYTAPDKTYRDVLDSTNHSKETSKETQWDILNFMVDQIQQYSKGDKVILDRCPIDNIVYTMWSYDKGEGDIDDEFVRKCLPLVRETLKLYDIIFFIPITKASPVTIVEDGTRETDPYYIKEIDSIFKAIEKDWNTNPKCQYCDPSDRPALIEIFGTPEERLQMIKLYLDVEGDAIENTNILDSLGDIKDSSGIIQPR